MNLIIFDIDGTLTLTNEIDSQCFIPAVEVVMQQPLLNTQWHTYKYSTDSGMLTEIWYASFQRTPTEDEIVKVKTAFIDNMKQAWLKNPLLYQSIPGAHQVFNKIFALNNWQIALATGAWQQSALFKLAVCGIKCDEIPKAFSDDHKERTDIIKQAVLLAKESYNTAVYTRIVYVGDRAWDKQAANQLGIEFIGVGEGFKQENPGLKLDNYEETDLLLAYLKG